VIDRYPPRVGVRLLTAAGRTTGRGVL